MLDIKFIRANPELVKTACRNRGKNMDALVDEILVIDEQRREINTKTEAMKAEQNKASKEIPAIKKTGGDVSVPILQQQAFLHSHPLPGNLCRIPSCLVSGFGV